MGTRRQRERVGRRVEKERKVPVSVKEGRGRYRGKKWRREGSKKNMEKEQIGKEKEGKKKEKKKEEK